MFLNPLVCVCVCVVTLVKKCVTWPSSEASPPSPQQGLRATGTPADRQHAFTSKKGLPFRAMKTMKRGHYNGDTEGYLIHLCSSQVLIIAWHFIAEISARISRATHWQSKTACWAACPGEMGNKQTIFTQQQLDAYQVSRVSVQYEKSLLIRE